MCRRACLLLIAVLPIVGCAAVAVAQTPKVPPPPRVVKKQTLEELAPQRPEGTVRVALEIARAGKDWGKIVLELNAERAPLTVENFLHYVDSGFYDGTIFHRVIPGYLIQGGGYVKLGKLKRAGLRRPVRNESRNGLKNLRGTIAMARMRGPQTATSQFFINLADNRKLDYPGHDGWGYCVFGKVVEGMDVVERIRAVKTRVDTTSRGDKSPSQPIDPPMIKRAYRLDDHTAGVSEADQPEPAAQQMSPEPPDEGGEEEPEEQPKEPADEPEEPDE